MNLIVTSPRNLEYRAKNEMEKILNSMNKTYDIIITNISGILLIKVYVDPINIIHIIHKKIIEEPWSIRYCLRIIPIQKIVPTHINNITKEILRLIRIMKNDNYRITIEKRHTDIDSRELIVRIASQIKNKVCLDNPKWIILIEIIGEKAGISIIRPNDILSRHRIKLSFSE